MNSPGAILRRRRARPPRPGRRPFQLEALEQRDLPTAALPGVLATTPANGASVVQAPPSLTITFDPTVVAQIDAQDSGFIGGPADQTLPGLFAYDGGQEIEIDRVNPNGTTTPILGVSGTPAVAQSLTATTLSNGDVQAQLVISLPTGASAPGPGTYRVDMSSTTFVASAFAGVEPTSAWATSTGPIPVATFTITGQGPTIAGALDLGTIGAQAQTISSALAPGYYPSAVELYRFELPQGPTWQLDAQMLAQAIGSPVQGALALFDASGSVIATRRAGSGNMAGVIDPSLIRDLPGGTYYLGVSSAGDVPGTPTGYDPVSGMPGTGGLGQPAGSFRLVISATPFVAPTVLISSSLQYADPTSSAPTGLDLTFSGPVNVAPMELADRQQTSLQVVDTTGRTWPLTLVSMYGEGRLGFVFNEPLPPGNYSLIIPAQGGLTDLGGRPVVGPSSATPALLASWTVAAASGPTAPNDAGVVWPGPVNLTWNTGPSGTASVAADGSISDGFVAIVAGWYTLSVRPISAVGTIDTRIESSTGSTVFDAGATTGPATSYVYLMPGTYRLTFDSTAGPGSIAWMLRPFAIDYEKLLENGVGQSAVLVLPSFSPAPGPMPMIGPMSAALPSPSPTPTATPTTTPSSLASSSEGANSSPTGAGTSGLAAGLLLVSLDAGLAGAPAAPSPSTTTTAAIAAPASLGNSGRPTLTTLLGRSWPSPTPNRAGEALAAEAVAAVVVPPADDPATISARADAMALELVRDETAARFVGWIAARLTGGPSAPVESQVVPAELSETLLASVEEAGEGRDGRQPALVRADLGVPLVVLVGAALTYRLARPIGKWWRRDRGEPIESRRPHRVEGNRMSSTKLGS